MPPLQKGYSKQRERKILLPQPHGLTFSARMLLHPYVLKPVCESQDKKTPVIQTKGRQEWSFYAPGLGQEDRPEVVYTHHTPESTSDEESRDEKGTHAKETLCVKSYKGS